MFAPIAPFHPIAPSQPNRSFSIDALELNILAFEVQYQDLCRSGVGAGICWLEGTFVNGGCRIEILRTLGKYFLSRFVILLEIKMGSLDGDGEDYVGRKRVPASQPVELGWSERGALVLFKFGQRRQQIVWCIALPVEGEGGLAQDRIEERLKNSLAGVSVPSRWLAVNLQLQLKRLTMA
jgi:hypothetical protein